jgi:hypothetical protein
LAKKETNIKKDLADRKVFFDWQMEVVDKTTNASLVGACICCW